MALRPLLCLFWSGRLRQVLLLCPANTRLQEALKNNNILKKASDFDHSQAQNKAQKLVNYLRFILCLRLYSSFITSTPGPKVIKLCSCSAQLSTKFILLINVKMSIIVGMLTYISMINTQSYT